MLRIVYSEKFISQLEKLSPKIQKLTMEKVDLFLVNPRHPSLKTHKLNGVLEGYFSFSVNHSIRIVFEYGSRETANFLKIGDHGVYR